MPTDYSKKKVVELEELLKTRSLPHTGKKADLIARLQEADLKRNSSTANATSVASAPKSAPAAKPAPAPAPAVVEDVIDWDDEANTAAAPPATQTSPSKPTSAAPKTEAKKKPAEVPAPSTTTGTTTSTTGSAKPAGAGAALNPVAVPNQIAAIDPSKTNDLTVSSPTAKITPASPSKPKVTTATTTTITSETETAPAPTTSETYTSNLPSTDPKAELAKRAARAARFGITDASAKESDATEADAERQKALERTKKFGAVEEESVIAALDRALPDRGTKRGRGAEDGGGRSESKRGRRDRSGQPGKGGPREGSKTGGSRKRGNNNGKRREQGRSTERSSNSKANGKASDNKTNAKPNNANTTTNNTNTNPAPKSDKRDKDLQAAEARKKRFAAPAATTS